MKQICCFRWAAKAKRFSASGGGTLPPDSLTRGSALDPTGGSPPDPVIGSCSARSPGASTPYFFTWRRPCLLMFSCVTYPSGRSLKFGYLSNSHSSFYHVPYSFHDVSKLQTLCVNICESGIASVHKRCVKRQNKFGTLFIPQAYIIVRILCPGTAGLRVISYFRNCRPGIAVIMAGTFTAPTVDHILLYVALPQSCPFGCCEPEQLSRPARDISANTSSSITIKTVRAFRRTQRASSLCSSAHFMKCDGRDANNVSAEMTRQVAPTAAATIAR